MYIYTLEYCGSEAPGFGIVRSLYSTREKAEAALALEEAKPWVIPGEHYVHYMVVDEEVS